MRLIISVIAYSTICFCAALQGHEGFYVDLLGLRLHINKGRWVEGDGKVPHVVVRGTLVRKVQEQGQGAPSFNIFGLQDGNRIGATKVD